MTLGGFCPLYYAVIFRNCPAIELLLQSSSEEEIEYCFEQRMWGLYVSEKKGKFNLEYRRLFQ